jgi:hypothetical protein
MVALLNQIFGKIRAILAGHACNKSSFFHNDP